MSDLDRRTEPAALVCGSVPLDNGAYLVEAVSADGTIELWIMRPSCGERAVHGNAGPSAAPHEQLGRLSRDWRMRIWEQPRCGQPRADGQPCRVEVRRDGDTCHHHRTGTDPATNERNTT
jgi:hypothetical protein